MVAFAAVKLPLVPDFVNLRGIGVDTVFRIPHHGAVFPGAFPQLVEQLQILFRLVVTAVMGDLLFQPHGPRGTLQIAGHNVPADPTIAEMVKGGEPPGQQVRRLVGQVGGDAEAQMFGDRRHGRHQHGGIIDR